MTVVCLTPTGGRPEALALAARWLNEQTYTGPATWVICDDCEPASPLPEVRRGISVRVIRPRWRWRPGTSTQAPSMAALLQRVPADAAAVVLEDDDVYLPGHIGNLLGELETAELVGERVSRYYNVATGRWRLMPGRYHAALATVGVRGDALRSLKRVCASGTRRIDMDLWREFAGAKRLLETAHVVGIKGMPGRAGIGVGHRIGFGTPDPGGQVLREWIGAERAALYEPFRDDKARAA